MAKANVKSVGTEVKVAPQAKTTMKLDVASSYDPKWYLKHEGELSNVTAERSNPSIGVTDINVRAASDAQLAYYTIANITVHTVVGVLSGIQVKESEKNPGSIYVTTNSRNIAKEGQDARWISDVKLERTVQAQILSYIDSMLVPAE